MKECFYWSIFMNAYFLIQTSKNFIHLFQFFSQCVNPIVAIFRYQVQSRDTQINVQNNSDGLCNTG